MKIAFYAFFIFLFIGSIVANAQTINCKKYHNGTFKAVYFGKTIIIKRYGDTQTEYVSNEKYPVIYKVRWLSDCKYTLKPTPQTIKLHPDIKKGTVLTVEMVQQNTNSFTKIVSANYANAKVNLELYPVTEKK